MQRRFAFAVLSCGVAVFLMALYDVFGAASLVLAIVGLGALLAGLGGLIFSLRTSALSRPSIATLLLVTLGVTLHAYEQTQSSDLFSFGWLLWALIPYILCLAASTISAMRIPSIAGVAVVLFLDLWIHYDVFVNPTSSTAVLVLIFAPLWSTLVFAPLAMFVTWLIIQRMQLKVSRS